MKDIEINLKIQGRTKNWIVAQLGISRGTFYNRLRKNNWKNNELSTLKVLKLIS